MQDSSADGVFSLDLGWVIINDFKGAFQSKEAVNSFLRVVTSFSLKKEERACMKDLPPWSYLLNYPLPQPSSAVFRVTFLLYHNNFWNLLTFMFSLKCAFKPQTGHLETSNSSPLSFFFLLLLRIHPALFVSLPLSFSKLEKHSYNYGWCYGSITLNIKIKGIGAQRLGACIAPAEDLSWFPVPSQLTNTWNSSSGGLMPPSGLVRHIPTQTHKINLF